MREDSRLLRRILANQLIIIENQRKIMSEQDDLNTAMQGLSDNVTNLRGKATLMAALIRIPACRRLPLRTMR